MTSGSVLGYACRRKWARGREGPLWCRPLQSLGILLLVLALALAACGSVPLAQSGPRAPQNPNYREALTEARHLLGEASLPGSAKALHSSPVKVLSQPAMGIPGAGNEIDLTSFWVVDKSMDSTSSWVRDHRPSGLSFGGDGHGADANDEVAWRGVSWSAPPSNAVPTAQLEVAIAPDGPSRSFVRLDGLTVWRTTKPTKDRFSGPRVRVTIEGGCPKTNRGDVINHDPALRSELIPATPPREGLLCSYRTGATTALTGAHRLDSTKAARLAKAIRALPIGSEGGGLSCNPLPKYDDIIVLEFQDHEEVDLWYSPFACPAGLDNGYIMALEAGDPPFLNGFLPTLSAVS